MQLIYGLRIQTILLISQSNLTCTVQIDQQSDLSQCKCSYLFVVITGDLSTTTGKENLVSSTTTNHCIPADLPTFPNLQYSFYGCNILKSYPLAEGIDPGFTRPIFTPDFSAHSRLQVVQPICQVMTVYIIHECTIIPHL